MPKKEVKNNNRPCIKGRNIVAEYMKAKEAFFDRMWYFINGRLITIYNGEYLTSDEMLKKFPVLAQPNLYTNYDNPNVSKNYSL